MVKGILFDLDGTLLDREASVRRFIGRQYDRLHAAVGHVDKESYCSRFIALDKNGYVWKDKVYAQLVDEFRITDMTAEALLEDYVEQFQDACVAFPYLHEMLRELRGAGLQLGMITNGMDPFQMNNIIALGIADYFETILISEREGMRKPDSEIFETALLRMDLSAADSMFVGDHPITDVLAAKKLGMYGVWKENRHFSKAEADFTIKELSDLLQIVESL